MPITPLARILTRQDGLITLAQAVDLGISARAVSRRTTGGVWQRAAPRVFLAYGSLDDPAVRIRAAALWAAPDGVISGVAAAWWQRLHERAPPIVQVTVPRRRSPGPLSELVRVRRRDLDPADVTRVRGVPVTAPALTVLETTAGPGGTADLLDRALRRHVTFDEVLAAYRRAIGSAGAGRIRELLVAAADRADSGAERVLFRILREAGITGWERALPVGPWLLDLAFRAQRVAVEVDGWAWHVDVKRFRGDREKQNALVAAGWTVLRFTWHDLTGDPGGVVRQIRRALDP